MRKIRVEKITLNIGAGKDEELLKKGVKLMKKITGVEPVQTITKKRIPSWNLRPGLAIGCKFTLRGQPAVVMLKRMLEARDNKLNRNQFDRQGNISFGIPEYIDIPGVDYDPEIKIIGLEIAVTLERPGYRVKKRKVRPGKVGRNHIITPEEAAQFMKDSFGVKIVEEGV